MEDLSPETSMVGPTRGGSRSLSFRAVKGLLRVYRAALSPWLGPSCRFTPTCSHYAEDAVGRWGLLRGLALALWRVLRCHPFSAGGLDPVPEPRRTLGAGGAGAAANQ